MTVTQKLLNILSGHDVANGRTDGPTDRRKPYHNTSFTQDIIVDIDECASNPCQNGATCFDLVNEFFCGCNNGYSDDVCGTSKYSHFLFSFHKHKNAHDTFCNRFVDRFVPTDVQNFVMQFLLLNRSKELFSDDSLPNKIIIYSLLIN